MKKMLSFILLVMLAVTACHSPKMTAVEYQQVKGVSSMLRTDTVKAERIHKERQQASAMLGTADTFTFDVVKDLTEYDSAGAVMSRTVTRYTGNGYRGKGVVLTSDVTQATTSEGTMEVRSERGDSVTMSAIRTKETTRTAHNSASSSTKCLLIISVFYALSIIQAQRTNTIKA